MRAAVARGDAPRLRVADEARDAARLEADLGQLGGLVRPVSPQTITTWLSASARRYRRAVR